MKIKAYDNYNKQSIIITIGEEDEMHHTEEYSNNNGVFHKQIIKFEALDGDKDNCDPKRWSDLSNFKII